MRKATAKSYNNGPMLPPHEMMARRRQILRMGDKGLTSLKIGAMLGISPKSAGKIYNEMKEIVGKKSDSLGLYLSPSAMKALHNAFGIEHPTFEDLQQIAAKKHVVINHGMVDFRVRMLATRWCAGNTVEEIEQFCIARGIDMKPLVKTRLSPGSFTGMSLEAYAVIENFLDGVTPNPKKLSILVREEKGRRRLFEAAPDQQIWDEIVAYCRRNQIYLGQFEEKSK